MTRPGRMSEVPFSPKKPRNGSQSHEPRAGMPALWAIGGHVRFFFSPGGGFSICIC